MQLQLHSQHSYWSVDDKCREKTKTACLITANMTTTAIMKPHELHLHTKRGDPIGWQRLSKSGANQLQLQEVSLQATNAAGIIMATITTKAVMTPYATKAACEAWFTKWFTRNITNICFQASTAIVWHQSTNAACLITANITNTAVMKPHATTAAFQA